MTVKALLPIMLRFGLTLLILLIVADALQRYVHVTLPRSPLMLIILVIVMVLGLYWNSVSWRKFMEREQAKTAAILGGSPNQLRAVLKEVDRLLPQDPLAAQRILADYSRPLRKRSRDKREQLWQRARLHRSAAHELEQDLQRDLTVCREALDRVRKMEPQGLGMPAVVSALEAEVGALEQDLTKLRAILVPGTIADGAA